MGTKDAERSLEQAGYTSEYSVGMVPGAGPVLEIKAEDTDPVMAVRTRDEVIQRLEAELSRIQEEESAPKRQLIHARTNSTPEAADALPGSKIRALAAIGGLGVVTTFVVAFVIDRRRTKTTPSPGEETNGISETTGAQPQPGDELPAETDRADASGSVSSPDLLEPISGENDIAETPGDCQTDVDEPKPAEARRLDT
ncbi:MAG: hypothetical protein QM650_08380 [Microlunatus sp.]